MNPLLQRIAEVRRRYRFVTIASGTLAIAAFLVGAGLCVGLLDLYANVPRLLRAMALVGILSGAGAILVQLLILPLARRSDNLSLALRIEGVYPELNDSLASTVQFLEHPDSPLMGDPKMRERAVEKAVNQARSFDFHAILDYRFLGLAAVALLAVVGSTWLLFSREPELSRTGLLRLVDPFGHHPWTRIDVPDAVTRIAVGQPFRVKGEIEGIVPRTVKIELQVLNPFNKKFESRPEITTAVKADLSGRKGTLFAPLDVSQKPLSFQYRILGNDGTFPHRRSQWHQVEVLQPPSFADLDGLPSPQIQILPPAYTGLPSPIKLSPGTRHLDMIQGTEVVFRAAVDRPLKHASIELRPTDAIHRLATFTGLLGSPGVPPLGATSFHAAFGWSRLLTVDETGMILSARFRPWIAGSYVVRLIDRNDLMREYEADLRVLVDPLPNVAIKQPTGGQSYVETAKIPFRLLADDEIFGLKSVYLEYRRKNANDEWLDAEPTRIKVHDPVDGANAVRPKRLDLAMAWSLKKQFKVGDIISVQPCADDYCDIFSPRLPGRGTEITFRIVSPEELNRQLEDKLMEAQQEIVAMKKLEDEAQNLLDNLPKDKEKAVEQVFDAIQKAKTVQERIGAKPNEGLRDKLDKMQQSMKDNKLSNEEMKDQVRGLSQELERLAQEEFPKLEQNLDQLRKEVGGAKQTPKDDKEKGKDKKSPLDKSKDANREIQKSLDDLAKSLDRWADLAQIKGELRDVMEKQKELAKETEKLKDLANLDKLTPEAKKALKEEGKKVANEQKKLEQQARELLDKVKQVKDRNDEVQRQEEVNAQNGDKEAPARAENAKDASKKLSAAKGTANVEKLKEKMEDAAKQLQDGKLNDAKQKQDNAAKTMEKMLADLDGNKKDDDLDRLRKKQQKLENAQNELDKIKNKVKKDIDAQKQPNAGKNDQKKRAEDLKAEAEDLREQARRLQKLQEPKAARKLQQAADKLDEAAKKAEAGDPNDDGVAEEMEAQERIQQAMADLEHMRQELAREQLARIGDRLVGLKERQDVALERTKELHAKIVKNAQWTRGQIQTLDGDKEIQQNLAKETQSLEEKLKGAMVFEHILKKAGKSMEQAGEAMEKRRESAKDRLLAKMDKDEIADEQRRHDDTLKLQKQASDRLDRLLEALKDAPVAKKDPPPKGEPGGGGGGGGAPGDGVPQMAQLKALKAEQIEVHERTKDFARANPNPANLNEEGQRELRELTEEQATLRRLFEQMTAPREGEQP